MFSYSGKNRLGKRCFFRADGYNIASLEENLTVLKADLKAKKAELESVLQRLMDDGMSASEILEKLK